jgi:cytochrome P450
MTSGVSFLDFKRKADIDHFPTQFAQYTRSFGDIYYWEPGQFHVINSARLAKLALKDEGLSANRGAFFISRMPHMDLRLIKDFFSVVEKMMVMSDGSEHTRRRAAAAMGFEDEILERFKISVQSTIKTVLHNAFKKNEIEFVDEIAKVLPSSVLADLFSIPARDRENFFKWSNAMTAFFGGASQYRNEDGIEANQCALHLKSYFQELMALRKKDPGSDYLSHLVGAQKTFDLTDDEIISQAIMMLVAGQVTTTDQINNIMFLIAEHLETQLVLKAKPHLIPNAIEELKRFDPAVTFLFRVAKTDVKLDDYVIKKGATVFFANHAINRDEIENPDEIDIHRKGIGHFAYGYGSHYCLGAKLGRLQMKMLFEELLGQFPLIYLDETKTSQRDHYSLAFSGFAELHLKVQRQ